MINYRYITLFVFIIFIFGCGSKNEKNMRPLEQRNIDNSTNYRYIFKEILEKERSREKRYKKDPFKE